MEPLERDAARCLRLLQRSPDLAVGDGVRPADRPHVAPGASTEPRPRGRGWLAALLRLPPHEPASTEPRPRGRGSKDRIACIGVFEAVLQRSPDLAVGDGHDHDGRERQDRSASTEPRPRGRGWVIHLMPRRATGAPLQRSPGLAVGDGQKALFAWAGVDELQRSPGLAVGDGWRAGEVLLADADDASTEPRPRGRGWARSAVTHAAQAVALQRSPDLAVGDGSGHSIRLMRAPPLQRSPGLAVGDAAPGRGTSGEPRRGFNGAPASRSGMGRAAAF